MLSIFKKILVIYFIAASSTYALDLELTQGVNTALPIGIEITNNNQSQTLQAIISNDLNISGQFKVLPIPSRDDAIPISTWRSRGADSVIVLKVTPTGGTQYSVHFELIDVAAHGRLLTSKTFTTNDKEIRKLAHQISDEVYKKLTGVDGIFSTTIAYILVQHTPRSSRYSLEIADIDGFNPQSLLISNEPIMSPSWSPDGKKLAYVSFENKRSQIYTVDIATGKRQLITAFPGINGAPAFSPDGKELAIVLSKSGSPKIYRVSLTTGVILQLTNGSAIDTEPSYSQDGKSILFTSNRGGGPQIYRLNLNDKSVVRVTFDGNYNARASFITGDKQIVLLHRNENKDYVIALQNIGSSQLITLTDSKLDESPSAAPNGKFVLYATRINHKGELAMVSVDGRIKLKLPANNGDAQEPAWSPQIS